MRSACLPAMVIAMAAVLIPACADRAGDRDWLVFSTKDWQGTYVPSTEHGPATALTASVWGIGADGQGLRQLVALGKRTEYPMSSPGGRWLYCQSNETGRWNIYRCRPDGTRARNLTAHGRLGDDCFGYGLSRDGRQIVYTVYTNVSRVAIMGADGSNPRLMGADGFHYMASFSPDGHNIAFANATQGYKLMVKDLDAGTTTTLAPELNECFVPQFLPDGKTLIFLRRDGDIYSVGMDGAAVKRLTTGNGGCEFLLSPKDASGSTDGPCISPDGSRIAYIAHRDTVAQVCTMNADGSDQRQITHRAGTCGRVRWSPDGKRLAFTSHEGDYYQLFVVDARGGEPRKLTDVKGAVYFLNWVAPRHTGSPRPRGL